MMPVNILKEDENSIYLDIKLLILVNLDKRVFRQVVKTFIETKLISQVTCMLTFENSWEHFSKVHATELSAAIPHWPTFLTEQLETP